MTVCTWRDKVRERARSAPHERVRPAAATLRILTCLALAGTSAAWAKPRTAVVPFGRPEMERQLTEALCAEVTCVGASTVMTQGHVDWKKVSSAQLTGVVTGKLGRDSRTRKQVLDVQLLANAQVILMRKKVPLQGTSLSARSVKALSAELVGVLNRAHGPGESAPLPAEGSAAAGPAAGVLAAPGAPSTQSPATAGDPAPRADEGASDAEGEDPRPPLLEVQATLGLLHRRYVVSGQSGGTVFRDSTVPILAAPGLFVAVNPLRSAEGFFASLGLEGGVATSVGVNIERENDPTSPTFPAVLVAAQVGLRTKLRLGSSVLLRPLLGWQMMNFDVHRSAAGSVLTGQPAVHWRAIRAGLGVDATFASWFGLFAEFSYLYVYSAGPLMAAAYFPDASPSPSFSGALGLSFRVAPRLQLRLGFEFTRYALELNDATSPVRATSVSDLVGGVTLGVRYSY
jgi:hypothetical protein